MNNFDWSKVTAEQLRDVPRAVVGDEFTLEVDTNVSTIMVAGGIDIATMWGDGWYFDVSVMHDRMLRAALACIDRIATWIQTRGVA